MFTYNGYICLYENGYLCTKLSTSKEVANPFNPQLSGSRPEVLAVSSGNSVREVLLNLTTQLMQKTIPLIEQRMHSGEIRLPVTAHFRRQDMPERKQLSLPGSFSTNLDAPDDFLDEWEANDQAEITVEIGMVQVRFYVDIMPYRFWRSQKNLPP